jgi:arylsulfatase A
LYVDEAIRFIDSCGKQPFLVNLWPFTPHEPIKTAPEYKAMYADRPESEQVYFGAVTQFDSALGRLITYLEKQKLIDNTLIILTSDNGPELMGGVVIPGGGTMPWGDNCRGATAFRDRKHDIYEGGIRVPGIIRWDGVVKPNTISNIPVSTLDLFPTFCAISGAKLPENGFFDGGDFRSALKGKPISRPHSLYWQYNYAAEAHKVYGIGSPPLAIRDKQWKLMSDFKFENIELYNLDIDPSEQWNFVKAYPDVTKQLLAELREIYDAVNKPYPSERYLNPVILEIKAKQGV